LFFMHVLVQGESHPVYYSLITAQPPDLRGLTRRWRCFKIDIL